MGRYSVAAAAALFLSTVFPSAGPAQAQTPAEFYRGRTVYLMIGAAGGDFDAWGRLVASHIKDHIPGSPLVVPQPVPGAGGMNLANQIANTLPHDGTIIGTFNRGATFEPLLGNKAARFDPRQMNWIGSTTLDVIVCWDHVRSPIDDMAQMRGMELVVGGTGAGSDTSSFPLFLNNLLGLKFKIVNGFTGTPEIELAVERGEVDGMCGSYSTVSRHAIYREHHIRMLLQLAQHRDPHIPTVPMVSDLAGSDEEHAALQFYLIRSAVGRPFVAPPHVPADRVAALRQAFDDTMRDPAFLDEARRSQMDVSPSSGQELAQVFESAYQTPRPVIERAVRAMANSAEQATEQKK